MTIERILTGPHCKHVAYQIMNDSGKCICSFSTLAKAALVLRYLNGAALTESEAETALSYIQEIDEQEALPCKK